MGLYSADKVVMYDGTEIIYREQQQFPFWLRAFIAVSMAAGIAFSILPLIEMTGQQWQAEKWQIVLLFAVGVFLPAGLALLFCFLKLETQVRRDGVYLRFYPFHITFRRFGLDDLSEYYARQYRPIREYGGWGVRCSFRNGKAYNVSGNKGVQLVFKDGKKLLIGTQNPEEFEQAIRSISA
jgi:hypothetical protein